MLLVHIWHRSRHVIREVSFFAQERANGVHDAADVSFGARSSDSGFARFNLQLPGEMEGDH